MTTPTGPDPRAARVRLEAGTAAVEIAPWVGGRLAALEVDGWDLLRRHGWTDREWGAFVMAPWIGRLRDARVRWHGRDWLVPATEPPHAIHGTVLDVPWTLASATASAARLEAALGPGWPFAGRAVHRIELLPDRLRLRLEVHAEHEPMPVVVGWHPWFHRRATRLDDAAATTGDVELDVRATTHAILDAAGLPTGDVDAPPVSLVDEALLGVGAPPRVTWPGGPALILRSPEARAWIVYTGHPDGVCVEPVTGLPDGLNGGILGGPPVAEPGRPVVATFEIAWA